MKGIISKTNIIFVLVVLVAAGLAYWYISPRYRPQPLEVKEKTPEATEIAAVKVASRILIREDQLPGEINAYQDVLIYPKVPGFVKWIGVDRGSVVKEGQVMVRMYAPEYLARRNEALARVSAAKADLASETSRLEDMQAELRKKRADLLGDQSTYERMYTASLVPGVIADNDVVQWSQNVQADKELVTSLIKRVNAKAHDVSERAEEVAALTKDFDSYAIFASYLEIPAPFNGYITERKMHVGSFVGPDGTGAYPPICRIKQLDLLRIVAPVPENDTAGVVVGLTVRNFRYQHFLIANLSAR